MFEAMKFSWNGREFVLPPDRTLRTIAAVENVLTLGQLHSYQREGALPIAKLSQAYGVMLRAAGAVVTDEEVYEGMFGGTPGDMANLALTATLNLQMLMIPPASLRKAQAAGVESQAKAASSPNSTEPSPGTSG